MRGAGGQLAFDFGGNAGAGRLRPVRKVQREEAVRLVEFAPFPRVQRDQQWRQGFTLDLSPRGLCIRAKEVAPIGSLLRIILRSVDGRPSLDAVARVTWSAPAGAGAARMGLEVVACKAPHRARRDALATGAPPPRPRESTRGPRVAAIPLALVRRAEPRVGSTAAVAS